jgi:hypothetical protein
MRCARQKTFFTIVALMCFYNITSAQFAPAADLAGTTAIAGDSSVFVAWATGCTVMRGPMNIADTSLGSASAGVSANALGPADDGTVSLGDGGTAIVTFDHPIYNGEGPDFAVFENGFMTNDSNLAFLELGFVEVSTDGVRYVRFPATTHVQDTNQLNNDGSMDCSELNNLAGKYVALYGTPFDLAELVDSPGIDVNNINYVKIVDVVGSIDSAYATYDHNGHIINDPWPTPYPSCGFDLDAVGVINSKGATGIASVEQTAVKVYPNPVHQGGNIRLQLPQSAYSIRLCDMSGRLLNQWLNISLPFSINTANISCGAYLITTENPSGQFNTKLIVE